MTANEANAVPVEESEQLSPIVDRPRPQGPPRKSGPFLSRVDPLPEEVDKTEPIYRPLYAGDKANQETIWDRSQTPSSSYYEAKSSAIEPGSIDVNVPPITQKGCLSHYIEYKCGSCKQWCLEPEASEHAGNGECRRCNRVPV
jgi:hypothetical protein